MKNLLAAALVLFVFSTTAFGLVLAPLSDERFIDLVAGAHTIPLTTKIYPGTGSAKRDVLKVTAEGGEELIVELPTTDGLYKATLLKDRRGIVFTHRAVTVNIALVRTQYPDQEKPCWALGWTSNKPIPISTRHSIQFDILEDGANKRLQQMLASVIP